MYRDSDNEPIFLVRDEPYKSLDATPKMLKECEKLLLYQIYQTKCQCGMGVGHRLSCVPPAYLGPFSLSETAIRKVNPIWGNSFGPRARDFVVYPNMGELWYCFERRL